MPKRWLRNWQVKLGVVMAAGLLTLGFYGLIQADPLNGASTAAANASIPTAAGGTGSSSRSTQAQPTPRPAPARRARVSRGS